MRLPSVMLAIVFCLSSRILHAECVELANLGNIRQENLQRVNAIRARNGAALLDQNATLDAIAQSYACLLASTHHFDHVGPDGSTLTDRLRAEGYEFCVAAENLARGQRSLAEAMIDWVRSSGHYRNLKTPDVREIGLGAAYPDPTAPRPDQPAPRSLSELARSLAAKAEGQPIASDDLVWVQVFAARCPAD